MKPDTISSFTRIIVVCVLRKVHRQKTRSMNISGPASWMNYQNTTHANALLSNTNDIQKQTTSSISARQGLRISMSNASSSRGIWRLAIAANLLGSKKNECTSHLSATIMHKTLYEERASLCDAKITPRQCWTWFKQKRSSKAKATFVFHEWRLSRASWGHKCPGMTCEEVSYSSRS